MLKNHLTLIGNNFEFDKTQKTYNAKLFQFLLIIRNPASKCFDDVPTEHKTNSSFQLYGQVYDADRQCEFIFGKEYGKCAFKEVFSL